MVKELIDKYYKAKNFGSKASLFIESNEKIDELVKVAVSHDQYPYPQYASWLLVHISKSNNELLLPHLPSFIDEFLISKDQTILRNLANLLQASPLSEYKDGQLLDHLLKLINDDSNKVALFVYSLYCLIQFTRKYPEIKKEVLQIIQSKQEPLQPAMRVAIRNYLKSTD
jgi:hypothetical protein